MKKLFAITFAFCAVIVAMACGSNDPDVDGVTGATEQNGESGEGTAKGKMPHLTACPPTISEGYTSKIARNTSANDVFSLSLEVFLRIICKFAACYNSDFDNGRDLRMQSD